jgi:hypothetical protein
MPIQLSATVASTGSGGLRALLRGRGVLRPFDGPLEKSLEKSPLSSGRGGSLKQHCGASFLVRPAGIEPAACGLKDRCSLAPINVAVDH